MSRSTASHSEFDERLGAAIRAFRDALRTALEPIVPPGADGARSIGRLLGTSRSTAWRCWRIAYSSELGSILAALPGTRGMHAMLEGLRRTRVDRSSVAAVESAWSALVESMRSCGFDHAAIRSLSAAVGGSPSSQVAAVRLRRSAFRGNADIYGIRTKRCLAIQLFVPAGDSLDLAALLLHEGVAPLRALGPLRIHTGIAPGPGPLLKSQGRPLSNDSREAPLVAEACTRGSIGRSIVVSPDFPGEVDLHPDAIEGGSVTVAIGETLHAVGSPWSAALPDGGVDDEAFMTVPIGLPTETLVMVLGVHRSLPRWSGFHLTARTAIVFERPMDAAGRGTSVEIGGTIERTLAPRLAGPRESADDMDTEDAAQAGVAAAAADAAPTATDAATTLLARGAEALGAAIDEFEFIQATIRYPLLMSAVSLRWRRPTR